MGDLNAETLARLLTVLEAQAMSNGELAVEVRGQGDRIEAATTEIRNLASSVDENSRQTVRLCAAHEAEGKAQEKRRTLLVRAGTALWSVAKSPVGVLLAAFVGWLAATHLAIPATVDTEVSRVVIEQPEEAANSPEEPPGAAGPDKGVSGQPEGADGV